MDIVAAYDRAAPVWQDKIARLRYSQAYAGLFRNRAVPSGAVLDVGTGTGAFALAWIDQGGSRDLTLLDPSRAMLGRACDQLLNCGITPKLVAARLEHFEPQARYGTVLAAHVLEHCSDPATALRRMASWLQPHGHLFLAVSKPHWCNWLIWLRFRHRWFSAPQMVALAVAAGLQHVHTHTFETGAPSRTSLGYIFHKPGK